MSKNKLDCKVGEIWETTDSSRLKEIVFVNEGTIVAVSANNEQADIVDRNNHAYMYNQYGEPKESEALFALTRKKVKMKTVNYKVFIPLWHTKDITFMGQKYETKREDISNEGDFIKWIEIDETFEVEDV
jgi:hypothetical protein